MERALLEKEIDDILKDIKHLRLMKYYGGLSDRQDIELRNLEEKLSSKWSELKD